MPRPQCASPSQYPISAEKRSTSVPTTYPIAPTASPSTSIARLVESDVDILRKAWAFARKYGWGNRSRSWRATFTLLAWRPPASASAIRHDRTAQRVPSSRITCTPANRRLEERAALGLQPPLGVAEV